MPTKTWKKNELSWRSIGAERNHFEAEDCSHPLFSIECKHRSIQNYPKTLRGWFEQARVNAEAKGKVPLLAIHLSNEIRSNDLVVLRRSDFEDLLGRIIPARSTQEGQGEAIGGGAPTQVATPQAIAPPGASEGES